jgi:hypothetical protein
MGIGSTCTRKRHLFLIQSPAKERRIQSIINDEYGDKFDFFSFSADLVDLQHRRVPAGFSDAACDALPILNKTDMSNPEHIRRITEKINIFKLLFCSISMYDKVYVLIDDDSFGHITAYAISCILHKPIHNIRVNALTKDEIIPKFSNASVSDHLNVTDENKRIIESICGNFYNCMK